MKRTSERRWRKGVATTSQRVLLAGSLSLFLASTVVQVGGDPWRGPHQGVDKRPTFRVGVETVLLQVSVVDADGVLVGDLQEHNFAVYEDGVPQKITFFRQGTAADAIPTSIALLIDASSSMDGSELAEARKAADGFFQSVPSHADIAVIAFDQETRVLPDAAPLTVRTRRGYVR